MTFQMIGACLPNDFIFHGNFLSLLNINKVYISDSINVNSSDTDLR